MKQIEENRMAKLALIYGMRLLPEEELGEVKDATVVLKNGRTARVSMSSSSMEISRVDEYPSTVMAAESPTSTTSISA